MNRLFAVIIALCMLFTFSACLSEEENENNDTSSTITNDQSEPLIIPPEDADVIQVDGKWGLYIVHYHFLQDTEYELVKNYTGIASNDYGRWYIENGLVNFDYSGTIEYREREYIVHGGQIYDSEQEYQLLSYAKTNGVGSFEAEYSILHPDTPITKDNIHRYETGAGTHTDIEIGDMILIHGLGDGGGSSYTELVSTRTRSDANREKFFNDALEIFKLSMDETYYNRVEKDIIDIKNQITASPDKDQQFYSTDTFYKEDGEAYTHNKTQHFNYVLHFRNTY